MLDDLSYQGGRGRLFNYSGANLPLADKAAGFENCIVLADNNTYGYKIY
jgi:hypothetical protein